jgi:hypothetical protein
MALWTQLDIDALKKAIGSGVLRVRYSGPPEREITYQSLAEMRKLLAEMVADVSGAAAANGGGSSIWSQTTHDKGFNR